MLLQGYTSDFSLPELFKFLQASQQTGRLTLKPIPETCSNDGRHFLWFDQGNLVAASNRLDGLGLLTLLQNRALLRDSTLPRLLRQCPAKTALGQFLRDNTLLSHRQLKSLFASQVLNRTYVLLQALNVNFVFQPLYPFPYLEMTGVKIQATEITLPSLRILKDWDALADKLPSLDSGLKPVNSEILKYRLNTHEKAILCLAHKDNSLARMAAMLKLTPVEVQKIGFRLIFVGIVDEVPLINSARLTAPSHNQTPVQVSTTFLDKLCNYLQQSDPLAKSCSIR